MKTVPGSLIIALLLAGSLAACRPAARTTAVTEEDAGKTVHLKVGDALHVELQGNVTTGFNWVAAPQDPVLLDQVGEPQVTPGSDLAGAPGTIVLVFTAVARGETTLHLDYERPWETGVAPEKTFEVTVVVE